MRKVSILQSVEINRHDNKIRMMISFLALSEIDQYVKDLPQFGPELLAKLPMYVFRLKISFFLFFFFYTFLVCQKRIFAQSI